MATMKERSISKDGHRGKDIMMGSKSPALQHAHLCQPNWTMTKDCCGPQCKQPFKQYYSAVKVVSPVIAA